MRFCRCNLLLAGVCRYDLSEKRGKGTGSLAISRSAIPRKFTLRAKAGKTGKQGFRIAGSMRGIAAGMAGEMILETGVGVIQRLAYAVWLSAGRLGFVVQRKGLGILANQRFDTRIAGRMR